MSDNNVDKSDKNKKFKRPSWLNRRFVITIVVIYIVATLATFLWTTYVTGWGNWFI